MIEGPFKGKRRFDLLTVWTVLFAVFVVAVTVAGLVLSM